MSLAQCRPVQSGNALLEQGTTSCLQVGEVQAARPAAAAWFPWETHVRRQRHQLRRVVAAREGVRVRDRPATKHPARKSKVWGLDLAHVVMET